VVRYSKGSQALGISAGEYATVERTDRERNLLTVERENGEHVTYDPRRLQGVTVYREGERDFSEGDRVQFTAPDKERHVANRELGTIESIDDHGNAQIRMDSGREVRLSLEDHPHLDHGYAVGAVAAYGTESDHNGVLVGVAASNVFGSSARTLLNEDDTITVNFNPSLKGNDLAVTLTHEGRHVGDAQAWVMTHSVGGPLDYNHFFREERAWYVSSYIAEALGMKREAPRGGGKEYEVWNRGWKAADRETLRSRGVSTILRYMGVKATDADTYSSEHKHRP
jgi:hypothetical protein